jgi:DNA polymerase-3 subunit delta
VLAEEVMGSAVVWGGSVLLDTSGVGVRAAEQARHKPQAMHHPSRLELRFWPNVMVRRYHRIERPASRGTSVRRPSPWVRGVGTRRSSEGQCACDEPLRPLNDTSMSSEALLAQARSGKFQPVYVVVGEEHFLRRGFVTALKSCVMQGGVAGLNEDEWSAAEIEPGKVVAVAKTVPMLSSRRYVAVTDVDRWEGKKDKDDALDRYLEAPSPTTVLVLCADKLHAKNKWFTAAKKFGGYVACEPLSKKDLGPWLSQCAKARGCSLEPDAITLITEVVGSDLSVLDDLIERLCLFLGGSGTITEDTVGSLIPIIRPSTVWQLIDAIIERNVSRALASLSKIYDPQDRGLGIISPLSWSARQLVAFEAARSAGASTADAAKAANIPPFRVAKVENQLRRLSRSEMERWFLVLRDIDANLKGGSKRPPRAIWESAIIELCGRPETSSLNKRSP